MNKADHSHGIDEDSVEHLIQDLEDGLITDEDHAMLMDLIKKDPKVCALYFKHMETVALLKMTVKNRSALGTMPVSESMVYIARRKSAMVSLAYGIAAMLILSIGFLIFQVSQRPSTEREWIVMDGSVDAQYEITYSGDESRDAKSLQVGDHISLGQGLIRFTFPSGVEAIVEGPSKLELTSDLSVKMKGGLAWFRVPQAGHGFTVQTERLSVVDLGTEFGVWFDANERLQVHVAKGRVRVEPTLKALEKFELIQDKAMAFDVYGRGEEVAVETSMFRQQFTHSMPYLHWSFDQLVGGGFQADGTMPGADGYQAELRSLRKNIELGDGANWQVEGRYGQAFSMKGKGVFAETSFPGIGRNAPRTIAAWVRHRKGATLAHGSAPYCSWGVREKGQLWKLVLVENGGNLLNGGDIMYTTAMETTCVSMLPEEKSIRDEWMHVASVYTGRSKDGFPEVFHYINGILQPVENTEQEGTVDTDVVSELARPVRFGASLNSRENSPTVDGDLDEFYLFRGALREGEIRQLMKKNHLDFFVK